MYAFVLSLRLGALPNSHFSSATVQCMDKEFLDPALRHRTI